MLANLVTVSFNSFLLSSVISAKPASMTPDCVPKFIGIELVPFKILAVTRFPLNKIFSHHDSYN